MTVNAALLPLIRNSNIGLKKWSAITLMNILDRDISIYYICINGRMAALFSQTHRDTVEK